MIPTPLDTYLNLCTQVYDLSKPNPPRDAYDLYRSYVKEVCGLILEPMCGTGRFLLPLLEEGFDIHGFDASQHMLDRLYIKAKTKNLNPNVWHGFIENLNFPEKYSLIFIPSGSFGLITDLETAKHALQKIHESLKTDGVFVFEAETLASIGSNVGLWHGEVYSREDGTSIIASFLDVPIDSNVGNTICRYELIDGNQIMHTEVEELRVRLYEPRDLIDLLKKIGFNDIKMIKAFDKTVSSEKGDEVIVYECRKK